MGQNALRDSRASSRTTSVVPLPRAVATRRGAFRPTPKVSRFLDGEIEGLVLDGIARVVETTVGSANQPPLRSP